MSTNTQRLHCTNTPALDLRIETLGAAGHLALRSFGWDILGARFPRGITCDHGYRCGRPSRIGLLYIFIQRISVHKHFPRLTPHTESRAATRIFWFDATARHIRIGVHRWKSTIDPENSAYWAQMFEPLQNNEPDCPSDAKRKPIAFSNRLRVCRPAGGFYARRVLKLGICSEKCNSELRTPCVLLLRLTCIFGCPGPEHDKGDTRSTESRTQFLHYRDNQAEETKESHPEKR